MELLNYERKRPERRARPMSPVQWIAVAVVMAVTIAVLLWLAFPSLA